MQPLQVGDRFQVMDEEGILTHALDPVTTLRTDLITMAKGEIIHVQQLVPNSFYFLGRIEERSNQILVFHNYHVQSRIKRL